MPKTAKATTTRYKIRITAESPGLYSTAGSAVISGVRSPMRAAALALLRHGASPDDKLVPDLEIARLLLSRWHASPLLTPRRGSIATAPSPA